MKHRYGDTLPIVRQQTNMSATRWVVSDGSQQIAAAVAAVAYMHISNIVNIVN